MKTIWDGNDTLKLEVQVMRSSQLRSSPNQVECLHWGQIYCYMAHESLIPNITYLLNNFHFLLSIKPHGFLIKHILVYNSNAWPWFYHVVISMLHFVVIIFSDDVYYVLLPFQNRYKLGHVLICQVEYSPTDGFELFPCVTRVLTAADHHQEGTVQGHLSIQLHHELVEEKR